MDSWLCLERIERSGVVSDVVPLVLVADQSWHRPRDSTTRSSTPPNGIAHRTGVASRVVRSHGCWCSSWWSVVGTTIVFVLCVLFLVRGPERSSARRL